MPELHFLACGSADDGKSTLIRRLLHESKPGRGELVVANTARHERSTLDMVMSASKAELAIMLVDARNGVLPQTRFHS